MAPLGCALRAMLTPKSYSLPPAKGVPAPLSAPAFAAERVYSAQATPSRHNNSFHRRHAPIFFACRTAQRAMRR